MEETQKFIRLIVSGVNANTTKYIDLSSLKAEFRTEMFNFVTVLNTSLSVPITFIKDNKEVAYIPQNNGVFEIKAENDLSFSQIAIRNDTVTNLTSDEIKIIIGVSK